MQQAITTNRASDKSGFVRGVLLGNALFSILSGLELTFWSQAVAAYLGAPTPGLFLAIGIVLLLFAADVAWIATQSQIERKAVQAIIALDIAWVIGSIVLLLTGWLPFSIEGKWAVGIVADVVAIFALLQYLGLRRLQAA